MKSNLSAGKFVKNNKKQVTVIMVAVAFCFMAMYVVNFVFMSSNLSYIRFYSKFYQKVGYYYLTDETLGNDTNETVGEKLSKINGIKGAFDCQYMNADYSGIVGTATQVFPLVEKEQVAKVMEYCGAKLISGEMPSEDGDILLDETIIKNQKYSIGDYYYEEYFGKLFKVVGIIKSDCNLCVGMPHNYSNCGYGTVVFYDMDHSNLAEDFKQIGIQVTENDVIDDLVCTEKLLKKNITDELENIVNLIGSIITIMLSVAVIVTYISFLRNRMNEYCLYTSIGYKKKQIYTLIMREIGIIFGIGILLGAVLAMVADILIAQLILDKVAFYYEYFTPDYLLKLLATFLAIIAVLQIPIIVTIGNIKTVDKIEDQK